MQASDPRPDFLVIGSQKAGTTTVHRVLRAHPGAWVPPGKDLDYFSNPALYGAGPGTYQKSFVDAPAGRIRGEVSPSYLVHPRAPGRIARLLPDVKLVITVREPIARAVSQYWDSRRWLAVQRPFADFVRPPLSAVWRAGAPGYVSRGCYAVYLARYRAFFAPEQICVLRFEELRRDPAAFWGRLFRFLGLDPHFDGPELRAAHNPRSVYDNPLYRVAFTHPALTRLLPPGSRRLLRRGPQVPFDRPPLDPATRAALIRFYAPWNARLEAMLGLDLGWPRPDPAEPDEIPRVERT